MTKFYTLDLPFDRWWSNATEDVPFEHIEEMREALKLEWFEILEPQFNEISPQHIIFYTTSFWVKQNQIIKKDDGSDVYYYIYESCNNVTNVNGETVFEVNYVLDEWMSHELYRVRNNMHNETEVWFLNKHHDRFIKKGQIGTWNRRDDGTKWTVDYKNQMYLRAPNTSIHFQTERINQKITDNTDDISDQPCLFFNSTNINQCAHCDAQNPAGDNQNQPYDAMNKAVIKQMNAPTGDYAGKLCMANRIYRYLPGSHAAGGGIEAYYSGSDPVGYSWDVEDGRVAYDTGTDKVPDYALIGQNHQGYWAQNTIWGPNYTPTWKTVDDFFNLERNPDGSSNDNIKRYRYQIYKIQAVRGRAYDDGSQREISYNYFTSSGSVSSQSIAGGTDTFLIVPIVGESGNLRNVPVSYWRVGKWWSTKGSIVDTTINLETETTFESIVQNTFDVKDTAMSVYTDVAPSQMAQLLSGWDKKDQSNYYNRGFDSSVSSIPCFGMHLMPWGIPTRGFWTNGNINPSYFLKTPYLCNDYCPYFIGSIVGVETLFSNLQDKQIKFFTDMKKMLDAANGTSRSPEVIKDNEPLLKAPLFWNLRHNLSNDGKGSLTADMIDWEKLYGDEGLTSGSVNIVVQEDNVNPTYNMAYIWDIENCLNKNFEISLAREELIYFDRKQLISDAPKTFSDKDNNTNYEGGGGSATANGMIQDATNSAYKSGISLHDASETSAWVQKNQSALGKSYGKASFLANQKLQNAKVGTLFGAASFVAKAAMSIPKIFEQRTAYVEQQRSYDIPTFGCDILVSLSESLTGVSSINFFDNSWFTTTYLVDYFADALFSYHAAYGYYFNTNETFDEIMNRNDFNYFLLDNGWNVPKIIKDSLDGYKSLTPYYRTRETSQEYVDRLGLGFRIHNTAYNNFQPWDLDDIGNGEIWLAVKFIGDDSLWVDNPGNIQTRQFEIFCYNPAYPAIQVPLDHYNIEWNGQDDRFHIEASGNVITVTWDNTSSPDESISGTIEILISDSKASFPYRPCFVKNGYLDIDYVYEEYHLEGDYSDWYFYEEATYNYEITPPEYHDDEDIVRYKAKEFYGNVLVEEINSSVGLTETLSSYTVKFSDGNVCSFAVDWEYTPQTWTYNIDPSSYGPDVDNTVNWTATQYGNGYLWDTQTGVCSLTSDVSSILVRFNNGLSNTFNVDWEYDPNKELHDVVPGQYVMRMVFPSNFYINGTPPYETDIKFIENFAGTDYDPIVSMRSENNVWSCIIYVNNYSESYTIWDNVNGFNQQQHILGGETSWNPQWSSIDFGGATNGYAVSSTGFNNSSTSSFYDGDIICYISPTENKV